MRLSHLEYLLLLNILQAHGELNVAAQPVDLLPRGRFTLFSKPKYEPYGPPQPVARPMPQGPPVIPAVPMVWHNNRVVPLTSVPRQQHSAPVIPGMTPAYVPVQHYQQPVMNPHALNPVQYQQQYIQPVPHGPMNAPAAHQQHMMPVPTMYIDPHDPFQHIPPPPIALGNYGPPHHSSSKPPGAWDGGAGRDYRYPHSGKVHSPWSPTNPNMPMPEYNQDPPQNPSGPQSRTGTALGGHPASNYAHGQQPMPNSNNYRGRRRGRNAVSASPPPARSPGSELSSLNIPEFTSARGQLGPIHPNPSIPHHSSVNGGHAIPAHQIPVNLGRHASAAESMMSPLHIPEFTPARGQLAAEPHAGSSRSQASTYTHGGRAMVSSPHSVQSGRAVRPLASAHGNAGSGQQSPHQHESEGGSSSRRRRRRSRSRRSHSQSRSQVH